VDQCASLGMAYPGVAADEVPVDECPSMLFDDGSRCIDMTIHWIVSRSTF
jgi:hypothetical protein